MLAVCSDACQNVSKTILLTDQPERYLAGRPLSVAVITDIRTNRFPWALGVPNLFSCERCGAWTLGANRSVGVVNCVVDRASRNALSSIAATVPDDASNRKNGCARSAPVESARRSSG